MDPDNYPDTANTENSEEKRELTDYSLYRKGYLSVHKHSSTTHSADTVLSSGTVVNSDDEIETHDISSDTKSETEFMDDEEHRATMMKLYHPKPKANDSDAHCNRYGYSEADKSISPELLRKSDATEPPNFHPAAPSNKHGLPHRNVIGDQRKEDAQNDSVSEPVRNGQSVDDDGTETELEMDPLIRPHIVDQAGSDSRFSQLSTSFNFEAIQNGNKLIHDHPLRLSVLDDKGENDTSRSDKFASGFLVDDHTQNTVSTHSKITVIEDDDEHGIDGDVPSVIDGGNADSKRSRSRKRSKKKKRSFTGAFSPQKKEYSQHSQSNGNAKYREYRKKDPLDVVEAFTASNKEKQGSFSVTISRTTQSAHSDSGGGSRNSSLAHLNIKFADGLTSSYIGPQLTPYGDDDHERKLTERFESIALSNIAAPIPVTSPKRSYLQHRRGKSLEVQSTTNSEVNDRNYIGRPVPIIRRVVSVQNGNQTIDKNGDDCLNEARSSDDDDVVDLEDANASRLFVPQPRYLSLSISEYTDVTGTDRAGSNTTAHEQRHLMGSMHHGIPGKPSMNKSIQRLPELYPISTATSNHFRSSTMAKPPAAPSIAVPQSRASKIDKESSVEFGKESEKKPTGNKEAFYFPSDTEPSEADTASFHRFRPQSSAYVATKKKPKLQRVHTDKTNKSYNNTERERGSRGSKKMVNRKGSGSAVGGGKTKRKTSKTGKTKTVRYSDENIETEAFAAKSGNGPRQRYKTLDLMRAQSHNPIGSSRSYHHQQHHHHHHHPVSKHYYGNAPIHNYNHYVPPPPLRDYFTANSKVHSSKPRDPSRGPRPATVKYSERDNKRIRNDHDLVTPSQNARTPTNGSRARFAFDTDVSEENEEYYDNTTVSNGYTPSGDGHGQGGNARADGHVDDLVMVEDMESVQFTEDGASEDGMKALDDIIDHFWRVIDIASNRKIPFEILKISLRVKNVDIKENHWDILLNELTNFQPSKNITLRMFKNFIFDRKVSNARYYRNESHIIGGLRRKLIAGLLGTDECLKGGGKKGSKPKLSNRFSKKVSSRSKANRDYRVDDGHGNDGDDDNGDDDDYYYDNDELDGDGGGKMKPIKFNLVPAATSNPKLSNKSSSKKKKPGARALKHKRSFSGFSGFSETQSIDTWERFGNKDIGQFIMDGHRKRKGRDGRGGGRERSSSHQSYLRSTGTTPRTVRSSSHESYANASQYLKYSIQQSIVKSLLECYENSMLRKMNASRFMGYLKLNEWRKALKYLLRCHFAYLSENEDVFTLEQFKFALYDQCNIRYDFSHEILPILSLNTKSFQEYVITSHSYCEWMLKHLDNLISLRSTQQFSDRHLEKLLAIINLRDLKERKKKKKKRGRLKATEMPFISISPSSREPDRGPNVDHKMKLRLQKASSMNIPSHHRMQDTPTSAASVTTATNTSAASTESMFDRNRNTNHLHIPRLHARDTSGKAKEDSNHLSARSSSRHRYSNTHGSGQQSQQYGYRENGASGTDRKYMFEFK